MGIAEIRCAESSLTCSPFLSQIVLVRHTSLQACPKARHNYARLMPGFRGCLFWRDICTLACRLQCHTSHWLPPTLHDQIQTSPLPPSRPGHGRFHIYHFPSTNRRTASSFSSLFCLTLLYNPSFACQGVHSLHNCCIAVLTTCPTSPSEHNTRFTYTRFAFISLCGNLSIHLRLSLLFCMRDRGFWGRRHGLAHMTSWRI
jgi:hypothetical protein